MASGPGTTLDDVVSLILGTGPADAPQLIAQLRRLDKTQAGSASRRSGATTAGANPTTASATSESRAPAPTAENSESVGSLDGGGGGQILQGRLQGGQDPLQVLDPALHSVGVLYILNARLAAPVPELDIVVPCVHAWAQRADMEQARLVPEQVFDLAEQLYRVAETHNQHDLAVAPLAALVTRFPHPGYLTKLHPLFLRAVMASGRFSAATRILEKDITHIDKHLYPVQYQDHLLYHYLGGTVLALLGDYARAAELLEICVSAPGSGVSLIQIDAYKKLVLVQLLAFGKTQRLPKYTTSAVGTAAKALCGPYADLAAAFVALDRARVALAREKGREVFAQDYNTGLVDLVERSLRRRQIMNLTETYITLSLGEIVAHVGIEDPGTDEDGVRDVERELRDMIASRQIFATLSPPPPGVDSPSPASTKTTAETVVTFTDDPEAYLSVETVARVTAAIQKAQALERGWAAEADRIEESKEFVTQAWAAAASAPSGQLGPGGGGGIAEADGGGGGGGGGFGPEDFDFGPGATTAIMMTSGASPGVAAGWGGEGGWGGGGAGESGMLEDSE